MKFYTCSITHPNGEVTKQFMFDDGTNVWTFDETHRFYFEYCQWVAEGNTAEEWSPDATE